MKKFNIDELIWFIILILLDLSILFLIRSGNITNFVSSDMIIYFYLSIIILSIFALFQFGRIFTIKRRVEVTNILLLAFDPAMPKACSILKLFKDRVVQFS